MKYFKYTNDPYSKNIVAWIEVFEGDKDKEAKVIRKIDCDNLNGLMNCYYFRGYRIMHFLGLYGTREEITENQFNMLWNLYVTPGLTPTTDIEQEREDKCL